jgi:hypothetical protein
LIPASGNIRILWIVLIVLVVSYLAGAWLNRQRSKAIGQWLQAGLGTLGGKPAWRVTRSISTGAEVTLADAAQPFRQVRASYYMMTREIAPLWGIELLRGKRDLLAIRADLRAAPGSEFEVLPLHGPLRKELDQAAADHPWQWQEMPAGLGLATQSPLDARLTRSLKKFLDHNGAYVERLSLRQRQPNLVLFVRLAGLEQSPSADLLRAVRNLATDGLGKE